MGNNVFTKGIYCNDNYFSHLKDNDDEYSYCYVGYIPCCIHILHTFILEIGKNFLDTPMYVYIDHRFEELNIDNLRLRSLDLRWHASLKSNYRFTKSNNVTNL